MMTKINHGRTLYDGVEWEKDRQQRVREEEELRRCGVKTFRRKRDSRMG